MCTAYLSKLVDVYLCSSEQIRDNEEIDRIQIDFEEYAGLVRYNMIPLWNLRPLTEKTSTYPNPCMDKTNYEHQFFAQRLKPDCEYLVRDTEAEITNIRRLNGDLVKQVRPNQYEKNRDDGVGYLYAYDLQGRLRGITGPDGNTVQKNAYDRAGRLVRQTDGTGSGIEYTYNLAGDRVHFELYKVYGIISANKQFIAEMNNNIILTRKLTVYWAIENVYSDSRM